MAKKSFTMEGERTTTSVAAPSTFERETGPRKIVLITNSDLCYLLVFTLLLLRGAFTEPSIDHQINDKPPKSSTSDLPPLGKESWFDEVL